MAGVAMVITALGAAWPISVQASQAESVKRLDRFGGFFGFLYIAAAGETNDVRLTTDVPAALLAGPIVDLAVVEERGPGVTTSTRSCVPLPNGAACSSAFFAVEDHVGEPLGLGMPPYGAGADEWDTIRAILRDGDDRLVAPMAQAVPIEISAGTGDDFVDTRNQSTDVVDCGEGDDTALIDVYDLVRGGECEDLTVVDPF